MGHGPHALAPRQGMRRRGREAAAAAADLVQAVERMHNEWPASAPAGGAARTGRHPVWGASRGGNAQRAALLLALLRAEAERLAVRFPCGGGAPQSFDIGTCLFLHAQRRASGWHRTWTEPINVVSRSCCVLGNARLAAPRERRRACGAEPVTTRRRTSSGLLQVVGGQQAASEAAAGLAGDGAVLCRERARC